MVTCKRCLSTEILQWVQENKRWKLVRELDGKPHECKRDRPQEISSSTSPVRQSEKVSFNDPNKCAFRGSKRENSCYEKKNPSDKFGYCDLHGITERMKSGAKRDEYVTKEKLQVVSDSLEE